MVEIVQRLYEEMFAWLNGRGLRARIAAKASSPMTNMPDTFICLIASEIRPWR
jgi:hypothetical protein